MKAIKRTVAALLATLMLATSTSFTLAAEEYSDAEAVVVAKVNGTGIMTGTDKGFEPSKSLTRAEAAAIIVRMKGISESAVKTAAGTTLFADVAASHWASGYVNQASNLGIVKGVSATEFAPDREVTIAEFVTMAIRALGAGTMVDAEGTWPANYVNFANEEGILDDVNAIYTATATRMNAATIVANTLEANMWAKVAATTKSEITYAETDKTILEDVLNIEVYKDGKISDVNATDRKLTWKSTEVDKEGNSVYTLINKSASKNVALATLKAAVSYDVWFDAKAKEVVVVVETDDSKTSTVAFTAIKEIDADFIKVVVDGSETKFKYHYNNAATPAIDTVWYLNGDEDTDAKATIAAYDAKNLDATFGTIVLKDGKAFAVYANKYLAIGQVDNISESRVKFAKLAKHDAIYGDLEDSFKFDDEDVVLYITKDNKEITLEDLEEDDVVLIYEDTDEDDDTFYMNVVTKTAEGTVKAVSANSYINIDGTKYSLTSGMKTIVPSPKDEVILYLNENDKVIAYDSVESTSDYALVKALKVTNSSEGLDLNVTLMYIDGTTKVASLDLDCTKAGFKTFSDAVETAFASTTASAANTSIKSTGAFEGIKVGDVYEYEIKSDKVNLKAVDTTDKAAITSFVAGRSKSYFVGSDDNYFVTSKTPIILFKGYAATDNKSEAKLEVVELDELDTTTTVDAVAYDIDGTSCEFVVIDNTTNKVERTNKSEDWQIVLDLADVDEDDYNEEITLVDAKGNTSVVYGDHTAVARGDFGLATIAGEELTDKLDTDDYKNYATAKDIMGIASPTGKVYIYKVEDGVMYLTSGDAEKINYVLSDDVLYLEADKAAFTSLKVSKLSKIGFADYDTEDDEIVDATDAKEIISVYVDEIETNVYEVIAVIYVK